VQHRAASAAVTEEKDMWNGVILAASDMMAPGLLGISYQQHPQTSWAFELCCDFI